jgi:hypothetical protein
MKFKIASGSTIGYRHVDSYRNNQDSVNVSEFDINGKKCIVGIVTDGCSSGENSEVGSKLITPYIAKVSKDLIEHNSINNLDFYLTICIINKMKSMVNTFGVDDKVNFICNNLLFTIVGFVIYDNQFISFRYGDGYVNGTLIDENNVPNYIAYNLIKDHPNIKNLPYDKFQIVDNCEITDDFQYVIASDGIEDYILNEGKDYARKKQVLSLTNLIKYDKIYDNKNLLTFMLNAMSRKRMLSDDTSIIIIKKEIEND